VKITVEPFAAEHAAAAQMFNARMRAGQAPTAFLLPEHARPPLRSGRVTLTQHVAVDEQREVRGGVLCLEHPALVRGRVECVINIQSPLSEGIVDPAYTFVAPQLLKHATRHTPYVYVVGMGSATHPLPRLLRAMGWTIRAVPFYFRMLRASYCVRHLAPLRSTAIRRLAGAVAAASGAAAVGAAVMHRVSASARRAAAGLEATPISRWTAAADGAWEAFGRHVTFGVLRTAATLPYFYSFDARSPRAWWISRGGSIEGWFGLLIAPMTGNSYFGDLVVATLTDCVGTPEAVRAGVLLAADEAKASGADLLITNQQHRLLAESCRAAGWRAAPSNFLTATSRALSEACDVETTYVTRRDGDGLTHLGG